MNDRELLELAAKAAALGALVFANGADDDGYDDGVWKYTWYRGKSEKLVKWNPLTDDGDALRLAVKLDFSSLLVWHYPEGAKSRKVWSPNCEYDKGNASEAYGTDPLAATRRAIVRAAAEIGRNMT